MNQTKSRAFLVVFIAMVAAGAGLVLTLPALFGPHDPYQVWVAALFGAITLGAAVAVILMKPPPTEKPDRQQH